jgi:uncharacterized protein HemX
VFIPAAPTSAPTRTATVTPTPIPTSPAKTSSQNTGPYIVWAAALALLGVAVTQFVQGWLARRSNRLTRASIEATREIAEKTAMRAELDALAKRYQDAAAQLGHDRAAVRLAGAYAMASLADD